jgi:hypothetical protein
MFNAMGGGFELDPRLATQATPHPSFFVRLHSKMRDWKNQYIHMTRKCARLCCVPSEMRQRSM